jgi:hypothetical protein
MMELYKTSLKDADAAIAIDPNCTKAWFRKGPFSYVLGCRIAKPAVAGMALMAQGKKGDAHQAWKQAMHIGGDVDVYMEIMAQFGACSKPDAAKIAAPAQAAISSSTAPVITSSAVKANGKANSIMPKSSAKAEPKPASPSGTSRAVEVVSDIDDLTDRSGGLTLSAASKALNTSDPIQLAAIAAAKNLISHGIGKASIDEQIG